MAHLKSGLRAFTLFETIVASVIILISFGVATGIFLSVQHSAKEWSTLKMEIAFEEILSHTRKNNRFLDEELAYESFYVQKKVRWIHQEKRLIEIKLQAFTNQQELIGTCSEIILNNAP